MNTFTSLDSGVVARAKKQGLMGREQISLFLYNNPTTPPAPHSTIPQLTALKKGATPGETKFLGGSAPSSKLLPFYTPFLTEKVRGLSFISAWRGAGGGRQNHLECLPNITQPPFLCRQKCLIPPVLHPVYFSTPPPPPCTTFPPSLVNKHGYLSLLSQPDHNV